MAVASRGFSIDALAGKKQGQLRGNGARCGNNAFFGRKANWRTVMLDSGGECRYIVVRMRYGVSVVDVENHGLTNDVNLLMTKEDSDD